MINAHVPKPTDVEQDLSQCLEETLVCKPISDERIQNMIDKKYFEILKRWDIGIHVLDRGCVVKIGCKSIAFVSVEAGYKEIGRYLENPQLVATQYGFEDHICME